MNPETPTTAPAAPVTPSVPSWNSPADFAASVRAKFPSGVASDGTPYAKMSDEELTQRVVSKFPQYQSQIKGYGTNPDSSASRISSDINQAGQQVESAISNTSENPITRGFEAAGAAAGAIPNVAADVLPKPIAEGAKAVMNAPGAVANWLGEKIGDTKAAQDFVQQHPDAANALGQIAKIGSGAGTVAGTILGAAGAAEGGAKTVEGAQAAGKGAYNALDKTISNMAPMPKTLDAKTLNQNIVDSYKKAIVPTIAGKTKTVGQMNAYNKNVATAVKSIVDNKSALDLRDEFGDPASHPLPRTIEQFGQAINQAKSAIFSKYDTLAKQAGKKGADVQLSPVADELNKIANDTVVKDLHPDLASYAKARADTMTKRGAYSMSEAGKAVQNLNKTLESFYRNPTYETASRASVDALIANKLRVLLDDAVSATTDTGKGAGYQDLKNQYGALRNIEQDVVKRGLVLARQTGGRGLSFGDVASAEEVIRGLAHMNPQSLATGAAIKGVMALKKYMTDPNRAIANMFDTVDRSTNTGGTSP